MSLSRSTGGLLAFFAVYICTELKAKLTLSCVCHCSRCHSALLVVCNLKLPEAVVCYYPRWPSSILDTRVCAVLTWLRGTALCLWDFFVDHLCVCPRSADLILHIVLSARLRPGRIRCCSSALHTNLFKTDLEKIHMITAWDKTDTHHAPISSGF